MTPNVRAAPPAYLALAALVVIATGSCGAMPRGVHSRVAEKPASYSEDERLDEIDRLDRRIGDEMSRLGLSRSGGTTVAISEPGYGTETHDTTGDTRVDSDDEGDDDEDGAEAREPAPGPTAVGEAKASRVSGRSRCERVCDSTRAICDAAEKICRIADSLPGHPTARDRCERARGDCSSARSSASGCGCE